uniref:Uncharacterized protein n=1 Tax=Mycena chlorophos TaxID=658473 RepID=A0ABQ0M8A3_MYCCL|nr:predicted protein [Mycena chlorophos]
MPRNSLNAGDSPQTVVSAATRTRLPRDSPDSQPQPLPFQPKERAKPQGRKGCEAQPQPSREHPRGFLSRGLMCFSAGNAADGPAAHREDQHRAAPRRRSSLPASLGGDLHSRSVYQEKRCDFGAAPSLRASGGHGETNLKSFRELDEERSLPVGYAGFGDIIGLLLALDSRLGSLCNVVVGASRQLKDVGRAVDEILTIWKIQDRTLEPSPATRRTPTSSIITA